MTNPNLRKERSEVLRIAHQLKGKPNPANKNKRPYTFGEAQSKAWFAIRLKRKMRNEVLLLTFYKKDGTRTTRTATLRADFLPVRKITAAGATPRKRTSEKVTYFELNDKGNGFKSFLPQNVVGYEIVKTAITAQIQINKLAA